MKTVTIIGGGFTDSVKNDLKSLGVMTIREIKGNNRYTTAAAVYKDATDSKLHGGFAPIQTNEVIIATGQKPADALSMSSWSYAKSLPILLAKNGALPDCTKEILKSKHFSTVYIAGGEACLATSELTKLGYKTSEIKRLAGSNRYATSAVIAEYFSEKYGIFDLDLFSGDSTCFALGADANFPDALVGGMLAGRGLGAPMLLVADKAASDATFNFTAASYPLKGTNLYILGAAAGDPGVTAKIRSIVNGV